VLIPKVVKVICFDTLLQVLILKVVKVAVSVLLQPFAKYAPFGSEAWCGNAGVPPPRVFWEKRLQVIENTGRRAKKEGKEAAVD
jgi:hypothetical protein